VTPLARLLIVVLLAAAVAVSCGKKNKGDDAKEPETAEEYLERARGSFLDKGKTIKDLNKAIELDDTLAEAYERRAEMFEDLHRTTEKEKYARRAIADYDKLMDLEPKSPKAAERLRRRGSLKIDIEEYDGAIADLKASVKKDKNASRTYEYLAEAYLGKEEPTQAVNAYTFAIKYDPNDATLYKSRARVFFDMEEHEKAIADLTKVIELQPDFEAYGARAQLYRELGQPQKALDDYEKARELNPTLDADGTVW